MQPSRSLRPQNGVPTQSQGATRDGFTRLEVADL